MKNFILIWFFVSVLVLSQQTWYVSEKDGDDLNNNGSQQFPFLTIQYAINAANANDIILVESGNYNDPILLNKNNITLKAIDLEDPPTIDASGNAFGGKTAVIRWGNNNDGCLIEGFRIKNVTNHDNLMGIWLHGSNNTIRYCELKNLLRSGIVVYGNNNIIEYNLIEKITGTTNPIKKGNNISIESYYPSICEPPCGTVSDNNIIRYNTLIDNPTHFGVNIFPNTSDFSQLKQSGNKIYNNWIEDTGGAIYTRYQENLEIYNNILVNNTYSDFWETEGSAIKFDEHPLYNNVHSIPLFPDGDKYSAKIYNNVIAGNDIMGIKNNTSDKLYIYNNIFFNNGQLQGNYSEKGNIVWGQNLRTDRDSINNNIYYGIERWRYSSSSFTESWTGWKLKGHDAHGFFDDPEFVDVVNKNYSIFPTSIAKNNGKLVTEVTIDYDKNPRPYWPNGKDIGAYEIKEAQSRIGVTGLTGSDQITHSLEAIGTYWVKDNNINSSIPWPISTDSELEITTYTTEGNSTTDKDEWDGFHFKWMKKDAVNGSEKPFGHAFYIVTNDHNTNTFFYLDMRDATTNYSPNIYFLYDAENNKYRYFNGNAFVTIADGSILRIWDINSSHSATNIGELHTYWDHVLIPLTSGDHPHFVWGPHPNLSTYILEYRSTGSWTQWKTFAADIFEKIEDELVLGEPYDLFSYLTSFRMVSSSDESNIVEYYLEKELDKKGTDAPFTFALSQNYPNPFNPSTNISFSLPEPEQVIINVYDVLGRLITSLVNQKFEQGKHKVSFDASGIASGFYIYRITAGKFSDIKKMQVLK
jgi:hypothetical protein